MENNQTTHRRNTNVYPIRAAEDNESFIKGRRSKNFFGILGAAALAYAAVSVPFYINQKIEESKIPTDVKIGSCAIYELYEEGNHSPNDVSDSEIMNKYDECSLKYTDSVPLLTEENQQDILRQTRGGIVYYDENYGG